MVSFDGMYCVGYAKGVCSRHDLLKASSIILQNFLYLMKFLPQSDLNTLHIKATSDSVNFMLELFNPRLKSFSHIICSLC